MCRTELPPLWSLQVRVLREEQVSQPVPDAPVNEGLGEFLLEWTCRVSGTLQRNLETYKRCTSPISRWGCPYLEAL